MLRTPISNEPVVAPGESDFVTHSRRLENKLDHLGERLIELRDKLSPVRWTKDPKPETPDKLASAGTSPLIVYLINANRKVMEVTEQVDTLIEEVQL